MIEEEKKKSPRYIGTGMPAVTMAISSLMLLVLIGCLPITNAATTVDSDVDGATQIDGFQHSSALISESRTARATCM